MLAAVCIDSIEFSKNRDLIIWYILSNPTLFSHRVTIVGSQGLGRQTDSPTTASFSEKHIISFNINTIRQEWDALINLEASISQMSNILCAKIRNSHKITIWKLEGLSSKESITWVHHILNVCRRRCRADWIALFVCDDLTLHFVQDRLLVSFFLYGNPMSNYRNKWGGLWYLMRSVFLNNLLIFLATLTKSLHLSVQKLTT